MRPQDALAYKRICHEAAVDRWRSLHENATVEELAGEEKKVTATLDYFARDVTRKTDDVFFIAADMTTLARAASQSIPDMLRLESNLASQSGFMVYEDPVAYSVGNMRGESAAYVLEECHARLLDDGQISIPIHGFMWDTVAIQDTGQPGIALAFMGWIRDNCLYPLDWNTSPFDEHVSLEPGEGDGIAWSELEPQFWTTHLLMQQTLAWTERAQADRPERRRCVRAGLPASDIKVVKLRKMAKAPEHETESMVAWTHRWLVSGHWRQQYYPGTGAHRPLWISPHVKGPEHKPLVVKDKATAWVR